MWLPKWRRNYNRSRTLPLLWRNAEKFKRKKKTHRPNLASGIGCRLLCGLCPRNPTTVVLLGKREISIIGWLDQATTSKHAHTHRHTHRQTHTHTHTHTHRQTHTHTHAHTHTHTHAHKHRHTHTHTHTDTHSQSQASKQKQQQTNKQTEKANKHTNKQSTTTKTTANKPKKKWEDQIVLYFVCLRHNHYSWWFLFFLYMLTTGFVPLAHLLPKSPIGTLIWIVYECICILCMLVHMHFRVYVYHHYSRDIN